MGRTKNIARRTFLIGSTAILGGVAFGTYLAARPVKNPLLNDLAKGEAAFNPFVKVTSEDITLITPHSDIGQGGQSLQAALIAEELDVDLDEVTLSFGEPSPAYFNTALAGEAVPFASFDDGFAARTMRDVAGAAVKIIGIMATGGSSTVPDQYTKLREAGAVARETLKLAASEETGTAIADLKTANGAVILPDGTERSYQSLAAKAATLEPVKDVTLRDPSEWRLLGQQMKRTDIVAKSTGAITYGIDLQSDNMRYAALQMNPYQGGGIASYDDSAARAMKGVLDVVEVTGGIAVIADNTWRAMQAAKAVVVDWTDGPYPPNMDQHWEEVAASFTEERLDKVWREDGDVSSADGQEITAEYRMPYAAHAPLEPLSAVVQVEDDRVIVQAGHQLQRFVQMKVAEVTGHTADQVIFEQQFTGGSFGHRLEFDNITLAAEIAKTMPGIPVKLTYSRETDFARDYPRQIGMSRSKGTVKDGQVQSWTLDIATTSAAGSQTARMGQPLPGPDMQIVAGAWNMPYAIPHLKVTGYKVPELAPVSSWRSVGAVTAGFFAESFLDELIHAAGADPLAERIRLADKDVHRKVLEAVGEMSDWNGPLGDRRGRGVAMVESFGVPVAMVVDVTMTDQGIRIDDVFVASDVGRVLDPVNFENLVQGGVVWGLGHAINSEITYKDGAAEQTNYHAHAGMRIYQTPRIHVLGLENAENIRGIGEPPVPPAAPALANAIFAATGIRMRDMPFNKLVDFV